MYNIEVPETITVNLKYLGEVKLSLAGKSPEWFAWVIANGVRQSVADADAGKAGTPEGKKSVTDKWDRIKNGEIPSARGGGMRLSWKDKAERAILIDWLTTNANMKADLAKRKVTKSTADAWETVARIILINSMIESGLSDDEIKGKDIPALVQDNLEAIQASFAADIATKAKAMEEADKGTAKVVAVDGLRF